MPDRIPNGILKDFKWIRVWRLVGLLVGFLLGIIVGLLVEDSVWLLAIYQFEATRILVGFNWN